MSVSCVNFRIRRTTFLRKRRIFCLDIFTSARVKEARVFFPRVSARVPKNVAYCEFWKTAAESQQCFATTTTTSLDIVLTSGRRNVVALIIASL